MSALAARLSRIKPSPTIAVSTKARELKAAGRDVIGLGAGEPDFDTPDNIKEAAISAIRAGDTKYTAVDGTPALKAAIVSEVQARQRTRTTRLTRSPSAPAASRCSTMRCRRPWIPATRSSSRRPIGCPIRTWCCLAEGTPVTVPCGENHGFKLQPEDLAAAITPKTKWVILNSPSNPTGAAYSRDEMQALTDV